MLVSSRRLSTGLHKRRDAPSPDHVWPLASVSSSSSTSHPPTKFRPLRPITLAYADMALYNMSRFAQGLLKTHETSPPSFTVRLYREYWTLNNGSKFLYNNQTAVGV